MLISELYFYVFEGRAIIQSDKQLDTPEKHKPFIEKRQQKIRNSFRFITENPGEPYRAFFYLLSSLDTDSTKALRALLYSEEECTELLKQLEEIQNRCAAQYAFPSEDAIKQQFNSLNQTFNYFTNKELIQAENEFLIFFKACKLTADFVECNNSENNGVAYEHAYKMLVICGLTQKKQPLLKHIDTYLKAHAKGEKPLHDALVQAIPVNDPVLKDLPGWRKFIHRYGYKALGIYQVAAKIEELLADKAPTTMVEAEEAASKMTFPRANEYPKLARLCMQYHMPERIFNQCLEIEKQRKRQDKLPAIHIKGQEVGFPGYHLVKLPIDDPCAYLLGKMTQCCQSIGDASEKCVIDGITRESNGFYVLLKGKPDAKPVIDGHINYKNFTIVGQAYAWLADSGNIVFDSWENLRPEVDDQIIIPLLRKFSQDVTENEPSIVRVTIGLGGKTPEIFKRTKVKYAETMFEGSQYGDALTQGLVYFNKDRLDKAISHFFELFKLNSPLKISPEHIINIEKLYAIKQIEILNCLFTSIEAVTTWRSLLGKPTDEDIIAKISDTFFEFLEILYYLNKFNLLTTDNLNLIFDQKDLVTTVTHTIKNLEKNNLLNNINIKTITGNMKNCQSISENIIALNNAGISISDELSNFLINRAYGITTICELLIQLKQANILTDETASLIMNSGPDFWRLGKETINTLKDAGILTVDNFKTLTTIPAMSSYLAKALVSLHQNDLLTDPNRTAIIGWRPTKVAGGIIQLYKAGQLTDENRELLLCNNGEKAKEIGISLNNLVKANILTNKNKVLLFQAIKQPYLSKILSLLNDAVPSLLTEENFVMLVKAINSNKCGYLEIGIKNVNSKRLDLYHILRALHKAGILTQLNYEASLNGTALNYEYQHQYHKHLNIDLSVAQLEDFIKNNNLTNEDFIKIPLIEEFFCNYNEEKKRQAEEIEAKNIIKNIKQYILETNWILHGLFPGKIISIADDGEKKAIPSHVELQWNQILAAESRITTYTSALTEIKRIGNLEKPSFFLFRLFRDPSTSEYYNLFKENNQDKFDNTFKNPSK